MAVQPKYKSVKPDINKEERQRQVALARKLFGERLTASAEARGMTRADLVKRVHCSSTQMSDYFAGNAIVGSDYLFGLADALGVNARWLLTGIDVPKGVMASLDDAEWVSLPRYDLRQLTADGKPDPLDVMTIRRDWLYRAFGSTNAGLWLTEALADFDDDIAEGDTIICADVGAPEDIIDRRTYIVMWAGKPIVQRYEHGPTGPLRVGGPAGSPLRRYPMVAPGRADHEDDMIAVARVIGKFALKRV